MKKKHESPKTKNQTITAKANLLNETDDAAVTNKTKKENESVSPPKPTFPIVGIGASAGGLAAFEAFFSGMPADREPGMAFVLVQHLAPDHKSILTELIRRYTRMQVFEVEDGMEIEPNCAYIIPPNKDMAFLNGKLQLMEPSEPRWKRLPIDFFFRSLAQVEREKAIGVVLSGTGSDGTQGIRAIKGEGGMVMAQKPDTTEYDGMPLSAIATGLVDYELHPTDMAAQIISYVAHAFGKPGRAVAIPESKYENTLMKIFILLKNYTGHDFSQYKQSTINRRIERRMAVHQIDTIDEYLQYMQTSKAEGEALFCDLLIGVTFFFRDKEAFKALENEVIPKLFGEKLPGSIIRVWVPGCSTGEEAYSLAILLQERLDMLKQGFKIQIFATDIDSKSIAIARSGMYSGNIVADISPERLTRFFVAEPDGSLYNVHKTIRDMVVFSEQNVIKDPPFSKLDLISCRNLLIYMSGELQKKLIPLFHYGLSPGGFLFLGSSETVGEYINLFTTLDRKMKLYQRKENTPGDQRSGLADFLPPMTPVNLGVHRRVMTKASVPGKVSLRELTEQGLLQHASTVGVLINASGDILYLHGRTGHYFELVPGETGINNVLKMAREGLRHELTIALYKANADKEIICCPRIRVKTNGDFTMVKLTIRPVVTDATAFSGQSLFLVILEELDNLEVEQKQKITLSPNSEETDKSDTDVRIAELKEELRSKEEYLQATNEELETSNEELKSSNEEMQSVNEELQSTNEELETSKEELQSLNEELATVNGELQTKVADLSRANNDMNNLLAGSGIGTLFVDLQLRIMRFTPAVRQIINLIQSDVGRPLGHIVSNLEGYSSIVSDAQAVLDSLIPKEMEVQTIAGSWYSMRIQPYRTQENVIEGVVITFVDVTDKKRVQEELRESNKMYRPLFENMLNGFAYCKMHFDEKDSPCDFTYLTVNSSFETLTGLKNVVGKRATEVIPGIRESDPKLLEIFGRVSKTCKSERFEILVAFLKMRFIFSVHSEEIGFFGFIFETSK